MIVVSPWSKGGFVNSQLFDHTSVIKFLEARFGNGHNDLIETNITPWRRAVVGDLTTAFDFERPDSGATSPCRRPIPSSPICNRHPDFALQVPRSTGAAGAGTRAFNRRVRFPTRWRRSATSSAAAFTSTSATSGARPRSSTRALRIPWICPAATRRDRFVADRSLAAAANSSYDVSVYGPNRFFQLKKGRATNTSASYRSAAKATTSASTSR